MMFFKKRIEKWKEKSKEKTMCIRKKEAEKLEKEKKERETIKIKTQLSYFAKIMYPDVEELEVYYLKHEDDALNVYCREFFFLETEIVAMNGFYPKPESDKKIKTIKEDNQNFKLFKTLYLLNKYKMTLQEIKEYPEKHKKEFEKITFLEKEIIEKKQFVERKEKENLKLELKYEKLIKKEYQKINELESALKELKYKKDDLPRKLLERSIVEGKDVLRSLSLLKEEEELEKNRAFLKYYDELRECVYKTVNI